MELGSLLIFICFSCFSFYKPSTLNLEIHKNVALWGVIRSSVKLHYASDDIILCLFVEVESSPIRCLVSEVRDVACGADFSVWLSSIEGASILYVYAFVLVPTSFTCSGVLYFCCSEVCGLL